MTAAVTLFARLARSRPEWIAQGLFVHAITTEQAVRALVLRTCVSTIRGRRPSASDVPEVREEQRHDDTRWRSDLRISWSNGASLDVELKGAAPLTPQQRRALVAERIGLLVVPESRLKSAMHPRLPLLSWRALAAQVRDQSLRRLLREADDHTGWLMEIASGQQLRSDFASLLGDDAATGWRALYRFLSTIDSFLADRIDGYDADQRWTISKRRASPYYGWSFSAPCSSQRFWFGIEQEGNAVKLALWADQDPDTDCRWTLTSRRLSARAVAEAVAETINRSPRARRRT